MRRIRYLLHKLPQRKALLQLLQRELAAREILFFHPPDLKRLLEHLLQYPKQERSRLAVTIAELLSRVQEQGAIFTPREQDGHRGRKWSADYATAFIMEEVEDWLGQVRRILAKGDAYTISLEPGQVAVTAGFDGEVPVGFEIIETAHIEKLPVIRIIPSPRTQDT